MSEPKLIDLDAVDWEAIQKAADDSNWMPNEYMRNEWVSDVCNFLKYGRPSDREATYEIQGIRLAKMLSQYDDSPSSQLWADIQRLAREILK